MDYAVSKKVIVGGVVFAGLLFSLLGVTMPAAHAAEPGTPCAVLMHGLARSSYSMRPVAERLAEEGYQVVNQDYDSTNQPIAALAVATVEEALENCSAGASAHFVTHSMGGILLRQYAAEKGVERIERAVMLGPPNQGSETVDKLGELWLFESINGPAGQQLGTGPDSVPNSLGPVEFELGVIAGTNSFNPLFSYWLEGDDDGKVSVARARVEGMAAFRTIPNTHTFMMGADVALDETVFFLANGSFSCADQSQPREVNEICENNL